ncbi:FleQ family flagellar regulatory protein [Buttiauxella ferragutiae ATCC 51602]|jgi:DNA-binding NtrC family response regulator|uniref:FleQ family flagellar regulatory protein n=1 Tax=Buttiauxella ferragutiae ATCC 51602 TaxID=1354252 RepID=A0ABX2W985_9ENTR|nr:MULTISPECIES: sigma-54 dependent transcriptional regulator [unclassified Buttiauxella]OAT28075.1 FleQ family flagellar regulatory protein [Buttiauxella ferragutiae ATCC 51602]TDN49779.1 DNA-binding NtrC family response regulator [Buttiauxella sp. JUb87]
MILLLESDKACADDVLTHLSEEYACRVVWQTSLPDIDAYNNASSPSLVILGRGLSQSQALAYIRQFNALPILLISHVEQAEWASTALGAGVNDYLLYPFSLQQLSQQITRLLNANSLQTQGMIMGSPASRRLQTMAHRVALADAPVLIRGETGTGKEMLAQFIHTNSMRKSGPFVAVNCAAIPESMLEAILFGHVKGAFTGAYTGQVGKFELANHGTLFLDEIAEMPLSLQTKLLRVLQEWEVERLGSNKVIPLDVRLITATNQNLKEAVSKGYFREDLFYRLDILPLVIPPLRQRREELDSLIAHFVQKHGDHTFAHAVKLSPCAQQALLAHNWPGNIRELENRVQRALVMCRGIVLLASDFGLFACPSGQGSSVVAPMVRSEHSPVESLQESRKHGEFQHVLETLRSCRGHRSMTAEALGITPRALRYKLAEMRRRGIIADDA